MNVQLIPEVRRRRYFENSVDEAKRRLKESRMKAKRCAAGAGRRKGRKGGQVEGK